VAGLRDNSVDKRRLNARDKSEWSNARSRAQARRGFIAYQENRPKKTTLKATQMGGSGDFKLGIRRQINALQARSNDMERFKELRGT
jgi:hypothetical protein